MTEQDNATATGKIKFTFDDDSTWIVGRDAKIRKTGERDVPATSIKKGDTIEPSGHDQRFKTVKDIQELIE